MIRRGVAPGTTENFEKSVTPQRFRRKSSSRSNRPFTDSAGALSIARIASEKIVLTRTALAEITGIKKKKKKKRKK
jgi:hypothetical protein